MQINDVIRAKPSHTVLTVPPDASVREVVALLAEHNVGSLVVSTDGSTLDGIVSERDVVRHLHTTAELMDRPVSDIMTTSVHVCAPTDRLRQVAQDMTDLRVRHVPVMDGAVLIGLVSIGDVVKSRIEQLEFERDQLDQYVTQS